MLKNIQSAIQYARWQRVIRHEFSDEILVNALSNFRNWRANPNWDRSLSPDELDRRIAFIEEEIASRL